MGVSQLPSDRGDVEPFFEQLTCAGVPETMKMATLGDPGLLLEFLDLVPKMAGIEVVSQGLLVGCAKKWVMAIYAKCLSSLVPNSENVQDFGVKNNGPALVSLPFMDGEYLSVPVDIGGANCQRFADSARAPI